MKKRLPHHKIGLIIKFSNYCVALCAVLSVVCTVVAVVLCRGDIGVKVWLGIVVPIVSFGVFGVVDVFISQSLRRRELRRHKQFVRIKVAQSTFVEFVQKNNPLSITDRIYAFVYDDKAFDTVSVYFLDRSTDLNQLNVLHSISKRHYEQHYIGSHVDNVHKRSHGLCATLYVSDTLDAEILASLAKGTGWAYEMASDRFYWCVDNHSMYIPFYTGQHLHLSSYRKYEKALKKMFQLFDCVEMDEVDFEDITK